MHKEIFIASTIKLNNNGQQLNSRKASGALVVPVGAASIKKSLEEIVCDTDHQASDHSPLCSDTELHQEERSIDLLAPPEQEGPIRTDEDTTRQTNDHKRGFSGFSFEFLCRGFFFVWRVNCCQL